MWLTALCRGRCVNRINTRWAVASTDADMTVFTWNTKGTFSLSDNTRQLLHSCLKFVWKSLRVKLPERKDLWLQTVSPSKKPRRMTPARRTRSACVWSLQSPGDAVGETVSRLDGGWIPASGAGGGGGPGILRRWHPHWDSGRPWNKSREEAERKKKTAPVVYFVETKRESRMWKKVIEPRFVWSWMAASKYGWKCSVSFTDFNCESVKKQTLLQTQESREASETFPTD